MRVSDFGSASGRRVMMFVAVIVAVFSVSTVAWAQAPAGPDQFMFQAETGLITWQVKGDKTADFESAWTAIRTKLMASDKPELKAVGDSLKMYKLDVPPQNVPNVGPIAIYYFLIEPASKTNSYDPSKLLYDSGDLFPRAEADGLFNKLAESLAGIGAQPMKRLQ